MEKDVHSKHYMQDVPQPEPHLVTYTYLRRLAAPETKLQPEATCCIRGSQRLVPVQEQTSRIVVVYECATLNCWSLSLPLCALRSTAASYEVGSGANHAVQLL